MKLLLLFAFLMTAALSVGCAEGPATSDQTAASEEHQHDHSHTLPTSYAAAVAEIKQCRDEVQQAFDAGTPDACDHALHVAAEALDATAGLAAKSNLDAEGVKTVKTAAKELFEHFAEIHHGFHGGGEGASFADVAERIDEAIAVLDSQVELAGEHGDHAHADGLHHDGDHDDGDHDDGDHDDEDHDDEDRDDEDHDHEDHDHEDDAHEH